MQIRLVNQLDQSAGPRRVDPNQFAAALDSADGTKRHPDLSWSAGAYVSHVADNFRIWAERLAAASLGSNTTLVPYDCEALGRARGHLQLPLDGALWSLERAIRSGAPQLM